MNEFAVSYALLAYCLNRSPRHMAQELFPDAHPTYLAEWSRRFLNGPTIASTCMDSDTFRRFVDNALRAYGHHALERYPG